MGRQAQRVSGNFRLERRGHRPRSMETRASVDKARDPAGDSCRVQLFPFSAATHPAEKSSPHFSGRSGGFFLERSAPPGSLLLADYESGLLMGYYVCGLGVVQVFAPPFQAFVENDCGACEAAYSAASGLEVRGRRFPRHLASLSRNYNLAPGTKVWLFYAGWITDSTRALIPQLQRFGCPAPQQFGENILLCQIVLGAEHKPPQASMR